MVLYIPRWSREFYFASDEGAGKIIVESSPRDIKPLFARLIPGFIFILWHFTFVQSARACWVRKLSLVFNYLHFIDQRSTMKKNEYYCCYCLLLFLFYTILKRRRKIYSKYIQAENNKQQRSHIFVASFDGESSNGCFYNQNQNKSTNNKTNKII